jgi:AraC family transcriptional regulator
VARDTESRIPFRKAKQGEKVSALSHARIIATSKTYGWNGIYSEVGENDGWSVEDLVIAGHYVAINRDSVPLKFESRVGGAWQRERIEPRGLWIQPANQPFSFRVNQTARWGAVVLDPERMRAVLGVDAAVEASIGLEDPVLALLVEAVVAEVLRGGTSGKVFADALSAAIATQLLRLYGDASATAKGGLTGRKVRLLADFIDAHIERGLAIAELASLAGLSTFHFARAFKQTTGRTPHQFVLLRRLDRARRMLVDTELSIADIAATCGFADQAHLARSFRKQFGAPPTAIRAAKSQ